LSARTKARKRAVDALYAAELREGMATELLEETKQQVEDRQNQDEIFSFANELVIGVLSNQLEIDETISSMAQNWSLERMPAVDRAILRLAVYEINFADLEPAIAISEAVSLANELSTDESGAFVNGVLSAVVATRKPI